MNTQLLKKAIEILERPLPKKVTFGMDSYKVTQKDSLGQECETSGCIAYLISTDSEFTDLGYSCGDYGPSLEGSESGGRSVLCELFDLNEIEARFIFYTTYGESFPGISPIEAAISRIKSVLNNDPILKSEELAEYEV